MSSWFERTENGGANSNSKNSSAKSNLLSKTPMAIVELIKQSRSLKVSSIFDYASNSIRIDNFIFTLHSTVTVAIFLVGTVFVTMRQYFGEPIECFGSKVQEMTSAQIQHFCWMEGVFTVSGSPKTELIGRDVSYPGVRHYDPRNGDIKVHHKYYQWIYFVLWIQVTNISLKFFSLSTSI